MVSFFNNGVCRVVCPSALAGGSNYILISQEKNIEKEISITELLEGCAALTPIQAHSASSVYLELVINFLIATRSKN